MAATPMPASGGASDRAPCAGIADFGPFERRFAGANPVGDRLDHSAGGRTALQADGETPGAHCTGWRALGVEHLQDDLPVAAGVRCEHRGAFDLPVAELAAAG
jgi:hypothetical protein